MKIYEKRTYSIITGHMPEVTKLYQQLGWPALEEGGYGKHLMGYFISDTGPLHQLIHLLRFDSDAERRTFWQGVYGSENLWILLVKCARILKIRTCSC